MPCQNQLKIKLIKIIYQFRMLSDIDIGKILWTCFVYLFVALFIGISQAAGIGGGPIINICLIIGLGYETKTSMAVTYIFLIGGSVASIYSNYGKKTPNKARNIIDTNLVIITLPMTVSGSIFGALFNHFISEFFITIAFTVLLTYLAHSSFKKFQQSRKTPLKDALLQQPLSVELQQIGIKRRISHKLQQIINNESIPFPPDKIQLYFQIIAITVLLMLFKGGNSFESIIGLQRCGLGTQICVAVHFVLSYFFAKKITKDQYKIEHEKLSLGYVFERLQDKMSESYARKAMIFGFAGGFAGGMLGIGGAIILVPAWLEMGIEKSVVSGSSAPLILASAFISMFIAFLCRYYDSFAMILFYFVLSFVASYFIKKKINEITEKYKLQGMIYLLLVIVMVMSLVFLLPYSFFKMISDPEGFFVFGHMC